MEGHLAVTGDEGEAGAYAAAARSKIHDAYRLAGYILGSEAEAQDAVQDALVKAWRNWPALRDQSSFGAWFDRIVVNVCRDRLRRHATLRMVGLEAAEEFASGDQFGSMFVQDEAAAAVAHLSADHRVVIALRFWQDLTVAEIAERLGLPLGTVISRLHYALKALRGQLEGIDR